ncbi:hypothetical protein G6F56_012121 [Rhizopus delemar]|nr:hypothetical protein G6F56_012121 [Rhizopus delemar]
MNEEQPAVSEPALEPASEPALEQTEKTDSDKVMTEAQVPPPPSLSVIDNYEEIAKKEMAPVEEEIVDFKCVHWTVTNWSQLETRVLGPVFETGGHQW